MRSRLEGGRALGGPAIAAAFVLFLASAGFAAEPAIRLSAKHIRTWADDGQRVFLMEGDARVEAPGGTLSGSSMVIWLDEGSAAEDGAVSLRVYAENEGVGAITTVEARGSLAVDERGLVAYGPPPTSPLLERARARQRDDSAAAAAAASPAPPAVSMAGGAAAQAPSLEATAQIPTAKAAPAAAGTPEAGQSVEPATTAIGRLAREAVELEYAPIDSDGYNMTTVQADGKVAVVISGGIQLTFGRYSMRAGNMVVFVPSLDAQKMEDFQVYAESNIAFLTPGATVQAERLFYDYGTGRATIVGAEVYAELTAPGQEIILRAEKVRALSENRFRAEDAYVTTCEFGEPHYRLEASKVSVEPMTAPDGSDSAILTARNITVRAGDAPVLWWPKMSRNVRDTHLPLRRVQGGNSDQFGTYVYTEWDVLDMLSGDNPSSWAAQASDNNDVLALLDYRTERGGAGGLDWTYDYDDVKGSWLGYYTRDHGKDATGFVPPDSRGRIWSQQRWLADPYQIDTELSYINDRGFLEEYFERESKEGKEQETYLYVKRPWEHSQADLLYRVRLNDYQNQVEYLPQLRYDVAGKSTLGDRIVYSSTTRADNARFRPDEALPGGSYQTQRFDTFHNFDMPLHTPWGLSVAPFTTVRGSYFDDTVEGDALGRFAGSSGAHVGLPPAWHVYDASNDVLDVNRLRHIVNFDVTYEDIYNSSRRPTDLLQFDDIDTVREMEVATLRMHQRLQTKRQPIVEDAPMRTVDLLTFDVEADYFPESRRDNAGQDWSDLRGLGRMLVTDDVSIEADGDYDTDIGRVEKAGVWLRVDHSPRTVWAVGDRYVRSASQQAVTARVDHMITDRWSVELLGQYDVDSNQMLDEQLVLKRNIHEFTFDFYVGYDKGRNDTTAGIRLYPLGALATRRAY